MPLLSYRILSFIKITLQGKGSFFFIWSLETWIHSRPCQRRERGLLFQDTPQVRPCRLDKKVPFFDAPETKALTHLASRLDRDYKNRDVEIERCSLKLRVELGMVI